MTTERAFATYESWLNHPGVDEATRSELRAIADNAKEIEDRFYKDLEFGTGGLRGVIGAGTNRINRYTVGRASQGLAQYVRRTAGDQASIVIAHDSRHGSPEFALEAALVFAGNGLRAYLFESLRPTPELSFAVRHLGAAAGVVITASHNPPEYNGYKVYGPDGGQLVTGPANEVTAEFLAVDPFEDVKRLSREEAEARGLLKWIGAEIDEAFLQAVASVSVNPEAVRKVADDFSIVYTPLHGAGNLPVRNALAAVGFTRVTVVPEQEHPDPDFSTVKSPNPEEREAFTLALELAKRANADILIGTDPDCDRMGAVVKNDQGEYVVLNGNQAGALMAYYLLSSLREQGRLPDNGLLIKTIVTGELGAVIAESFGLTVMNTLTGFKYIGEKMTQYEKTGEYAYLFGYEESYGYLAGTHARDKDAVVAAVLICEAAAYYKSQGKTLYGVLLELYERYGYYREHLESRTLKGIDGVAQIGRIMADWRDAPPSEMAGVAVSKQLDYSHGLDGLPKENVLKFILADGSWFCLRPSGTEPKIKVYFGVKGQSAEDAEAKLQRLIPAVMSRVDR
ncbi:phospho-sugar mutase [Paenibacillus thermoaerophilus]|uniref:phosphoglucomutase (alpha-D-glucose-1,6-bisphosphate-dependent) n=1 Tax=Paenibacillus thermoaerophilus TaxID=1215385 RepID=A0ABW2V7I9_9BACL|nr:phospho-sugar mutase [Paenibacillus thermoaerophilus]TMV12506.1 phospho-sugar mutase [Paenibacillus thermoaerophilus]